MKKQLFTITILLCSLSAYAQSWQWAHSAGVTGGNEIATATASDASGNVYVAGDFNTSNLTIGSTTLTNSGGYDFFIVKYDTYGNVVWAKKTGGTKDDIINGITVDNGGNILITGEFESNVLSFGGVSLTVTTANFSDIFVAKLDPSGTALWAKKGGGTGDDVAIAICTDAFDNVFITGSYNGPTISFGTNTMTKSGSVDALIVKLDINGNFVWGQHSTGANSDGQGYGICTDSNGDVFATGFFQGNGIDFGSTALANSGLSDIFIAKYTGTGIPIWAKSAGNIDQEQAFGICADMNGNLFITGFYLSSSLNFGGVTITNTNASSRDIFVVKYDGAGNVVWAKGAGGSGNDESRCITTDNLGNIYTTGYFSSSVAFGGTTLTSNGNEDIFIARYNSSGNIGYAKGAGGASHDIASGISIDLYHNAYLTGGFLSTSFALGSTTLINTDVGDSVADAFVTKLNSVNAIDDSESLDLISIFPNPTAGQFEINLPGDANEIKISNSVGEITALVSPKGNTKAFFNIKGNGVYLVQVFSNQYVVTKKLIVNH